MQSIIHITVIQDASAHNLQQSYAGGIWLCEVKEKNISRLPSIPCKFTPLASCVLEPGRH